MPTLRIYDDPHDAAIDAAHRNLVRAITAMNGAISQVNQLHLELPTPEQEYDDADQAHEALDGIVGSLVSLDSIIRRAARRLA